MRQKRWLLVDLMNIFHRGFAVGYETPNELVEWIVHKVNRIAHRTDSFPIFFSEKGKPHIPQRVKEVLKKKYKGSREKSPTSKGWSWLKAQTVFRESVSLLFRVATVMEFPHLEADVLIAWKTRQLREKGEEVLILSSDKDLLQLLPLGVKILRMKQGGEISVVSSSSRFWEILESPCPFSPWAIGIFRLLVGDKSDNLSGVRGIGPKKAGTLLSALPEDLLIDVALEEKKPSEVIPVVDEEKEYLDVVFPFINLLVPKLPEGFNEKAATLSQFSHKSVASLLFR